MITKPELISLVFIHSSLIIQKTNLPEFEWELVNLGKGDFVTVGEKQWQSQVQEKIFELKATRSDGKCIVLLFRTTDWDTGNESNFTCAAASIVRRDFDLPVDFVLRLQYVPDIELKSVNQVEIESCLGRLDWFEGRSGSWGFDKSSRLIIERTFKTVCYMNRNFRIGQNLRTSLAKFGE